MEQINIDIVPVGVCKTAHASQFDMGRQIRFNLYNQGSPYTLTGAETVTMVVNGEEESITNTSDNYVIWDVADSDCETAGVIGCELRIVLGSMLIGSRNFFLEVEMDPYGDSNLRIVSVGPADICTFETTLNEPLPSVKCTLTPSLTGYTAVNLTACGVNLWDEDTESGYISDLDGSIVANADYVHSKNFNICVPETEVCCLKPANIWFSIFWYDETQTFISSVAHQSATTKVNTVPSNARFFKICVKESTYQNNVGVNYPSTDTSYHAYTGNAYAIALGDTYYGGTLDVTTGVLTVEYDSSLQPITPYDVQLSPTAVRAIVGANNVYSDTGETELKYLTID